MTKENSTTREFQISRILYLMRCLAICTVVLAHTTDGFIENRVDYYVIKRLASTGVFIFFFVSGYYCRPSETRKLLRKLFVSIGMPWLFLGSFNYVLGSWKSGQNMILVDYLCYIFGSGSMYYYCTMYVLVRIIVNTLLIKSKNARPFLYVMVGVNVLSTVTSKWISPVILQLTGGILTPYLNVFNWLGIFAAGYIAKQKNILFMLQNQSRKTKTTIFFIGILILMLGFEDWNFGYFGYMGIICEFIFFLMMFLMAAQIRPESAIMTAGESIGKNTMLIYMMHYPLLSLLQKDVLINGSVFLILLRCVLVAGILGAAAEFIYKFCLKFPRMKWVRILLGVR